MAMTALQAAAVLLLGGSALLRGDGKSLHYGARKLVSEALGLAYERAGGEGASCMPRVASGAAAPPPAFGGTVPIVPTTMTPWGGSSTYGADVGNPSPIALLW
jgi:hypothetical protein